MKRALGLWFLLVFASGCASVNYLPEASPYGRTLIETMPPGGRVEINGQYVGMAPLRVDTPVNDSGWALRPIQIVVYPSAAGQYVQTRSLGYGDFMPTHLYFDLNLPPPPQPLVVQVNDPQASHHHDEDDEEKFRRQGTHAAQNLMSAPPVIVAHQTQTQQQSYVGRSPTTNNQNSSYQRPGSQQFQNAQSPATQAQVISNPATRSTNDPYAGSHDQGVTGYPAVPHMTSTPPVSTNSGTPGAYVYPSAAQTPVIQPVSPVSGTPVITHENHSVKNEPPKDSTPTLIERPQFQQTAAPVLARPEPGARDEVRKPPFSVPSSARTESGVSQIQKRPVFTPSLTATETGTSTATRTSTSTQTSTGTLMAQSRN